MNSKGNDSTLFHQGLHERLGLNTSVKKYHAMVDIETGGHPPNGAILEVAAVGFHPTDPSSVGPVYYAGISRESNEEHGLTIDDDTRSFWETQPRYEEVFGGKRNIADVLSEIDAFLAPFKKVWSKSPIFDMGLIRDAMLATGYCGRSRNHWSFTNRRRFRDVRTALDVARRNRRINQEDYGLEWPYDRCHHPIADCLKQIGDLYESKWAGPFIPLTAISRPIPLDVVKLWRQINELENPNVGLSGFLTTVT